MLNGRRLAALAAIASSFVGAGGLVASAAHAADAVGSGDTLEEVVVTAERISTDIMHASEAVSALSGDDVVNNHIVSWNDLQGVVPGLSIQVAGGSTTINIRGVGDAFSNPNIAQGVPIYRDGALVPLGVGDEPFWDLSGVQVLRGPQGTLTGANSVGGAIYLSETAPKIDDHSAYAMVNVGNYHRIQAQGAMSLPVSDVMAVRVGVYTDRRDSFSNNDTPYNFQTLGAGMPPFSNQTDPGQMDQYALRGSVLFQPIDRLSIVGKVDYMQNNTGYVAEKPIAISSTSVNGVTTNCPAPGSYFNAAPATFSQVPAGCGFAAFAPADPYTIGYAVPDTEGRESLWREDLEANYKFWDNGPTLRLLGAAQYNILKTQSENTASEYYSGGSINGSHEHTFTYEADFISPTEQKLQWVAGAFHWHDSNGFLYTGPGFTGGPFCNNQYDPTTGIAAAPYCSVPNGGGIFLSGANAKSATAVFGNVQYQLTDQWKLEAGVRETWDINSNPREPCALPNGPVCQNGSYNSFHFYNAPNPADPYNLSLSNNGFDNWGEESDHLFTYKLAADYSLTTHDFLYVQVATGAKSGGIQNQGNDPACHGGVDPVGAGSHCFKPEKDIDYEVGYKGSYLDGHFNFEANAYYMEYSSMQVNTHDPITGSGTIANAGSANVKGLEVSAQGNLAGFVLSGNASYTKSQLNIGSIVNVDACSLNAICNANNNIGACAPGQPNGGLNNHGATGCFNYVGGVTVNGQYLPYIEVVNGIQLPNSPKLQGNLSLSYRFAMSGRDGLTPRVDFQYTGKQYGSIYNDPLDQLASRTNLNASLSWDHEHWQVQAYATNLTNQVYAVAFNDQSAELYNNPRQFGLQVRWGSN